MKTDISTSVSADILPAASAHLGGTAERNVIYDSQAACLVFCCGIVFKISSLPGLVASEMLSGTLWLYLFMIAVDVLMFAAISAYASTGADALFASRAPVLFRAFSALSSAWLLLKGVIYFCYTVVFLMVDLFVAVPPYVVVLALAAPVLYLGCKGVVSIARCAELFTPVLLLVFVANLALLDADMDAGRNLPLEAMPPEEFFKRGFLFGMWLGDMLPLAFSSIKRKKFPYLVVGTGVSYALVAVVALIAVAMYGAALPYVYNMVIRLSGFNKLSLEIGRMEWAAIFIVIVMAMLSLSLHMWGAAEGSRRAFGSPLPARILFAAGVIAVPLALPSAHVLTEFSVTEFGYVATGISLLPALVCGAEGIRAHRAHKRKATPPQEDGGEKT